MQIVLDLLKKNNEVVNKTKICTIFLHNNKINK